ncbi:MAG: (d)CMP kinase, partial [Simkaniaceae bacterium]|nr:(d)CMP kinase [Simkaniaceae bacterium]
YLTARPEVRAQRRLKDFQKKGDAVTFEDVLASIKERDHTDMTRKTSPLRQADDAVLVDSSDLTATEVVKEILKLI